MGLDQYAYTKSSPQDAKPAFVWRKHAKLQTFMEDLWVTKTGQSAVDLNCAELELSQHDIEALQKLVTVGGLPTLEGGFFFGHQYQDEAAAEYADFDAQFCQWAKEQIAEGETVIYSCWW